MSANYFINLIENVTFQATLSTARVETRDLYGLYEGVPVGDRGTGYNMALPDRITLFQVPIEEASRSENDILVTIGETVVHEFGHYFGLTEEEIEAIEERYWHRDQDA